MYEIVPLELRWHYPYDISQEATGCLAGADADKQGAVLSVDWHPTENRLLTTGFDGATKIWSFDNTAPLVSSISHVCTMFLNERTPSNCGRWSPDGVLIAASYNSGEVVLWKKSASDVVSNAYEFNLEHWCTVKILRGHADREVYSLCFSPDMRFLMSGALDGSFLIYDLVHDFIKAYNPTNPHTSSVQGCVWDPLGVYITTIGADRRVVITANTLGHEAGMQGNFVPHDTITYSEKGGWLFRGDGATSYYRHGSWSPDGLMLALPCGWVASDNVEQQQQQQQQNNACYVFLRHLFQKPFKALTVSGDASVIGAKFSPVLYQSPVKSEGDETSVWGPSDYTLAIAVFTSDSVVMFTTAATHPVARYSDMHYAPLTDLSWCSDGQRFIVSSEDGFCSIGSYPHRACCNLDDTSSSSITVLQKIVLMNITNMRSRSCATGKTVAVPKLDGNTKSVIQVRRKKRERADEGNNASTNQTLHVDGAAGVEAPSPTVSPNKQQQQQNDEAPKLVETVTVVEQIEV